MDIRIAARETLKLVHKAKKLPSEHTQYGRDHIKNMLERIYFVEIEGEKAHRWLGWAQCAICLGEGATLNELKEINHHA